MDEPLKQKKVGLSFSQTVLNPLEVFPTKRDSITQIFHGIHKKKRKNNNRKWLDPIHTDQNFGLYLDSNSLNGEIRREFRRTESYNLFNKSSRLNTSLNELNPHSSSQKNYVLVEADRLEELIKLEKTLKKEKDLLGEQCVWALNDVSIESRIPIPVNRNAVHYLCNSQIKRVQKEIVILNEKWVDFCKKNHYDKPHLFWKNSYLKNAPYSQKALKLRLVKESQEVWRLRKDRDTMLYEDDLSHLSRLYYDAVVRLNDYERYYILASRYGEYSITEYNKDSLPGRRYFIKATKGALKFQMLWDRYWAMTKLRRYKAAKCIQKYWRRYITFKQLHPIIRLRLKVGKKTYYMFCWAKWKEYNSLCRKIKTAIRNQLFSYVQLCFVAWKGYTRNVRVSHERAIQKSNIYYKIIQRRFKMWLEYVEFIKKLKRHFRRLFAFPHFDMWLEYVKLRKHLRKLDQASASIQSIIRAFIGKRRYHKKIMAQKVLRNFNILVLAVRLAKKKREKVILEGFEEWVPNETVRRFNRLNELEKQKLARRHQILANKEKEGLSLLKKHLKTSYGILQLADRVKQFTQSIRAKVFEPLTEEEKEFISLSKPEKIQFMSKVLMKECSDIYRALEIHNYNAKNPSYIKCPDIRCQATFVSDEQYHNHLEASEIHHQQSLKFTHFHLMIRHRKGFELLKDFLTKKYGISELLNCLDAWMAIQDWRKSPTMSNDYTSKGLNLYEQYIAADAPRHLNFIDSQVYNKILRNIMAIKSREYKGFYKMERAKQNLIRGILGVSGREYKMWSSEGVLKPTIFDDLEWACFIRLFDYYDSNHEYRDSESFQAYLKVLEEEKEYKRLEFIEDYRVYRSNAIKTWTHAFKTHENNMLDKAFEIVNLYLDKESSRILDESIKSEVTKRVKKIHYEEQLIREEQLCVMNESLFWAEQDILEHIYEFYVSTMLNSMLQVKEYRRGMLQYAGLVKTSMKKKVEIDLTEDKSANEWFKEFFKSAVEKEKTGSFTDEKDLLISKFQKRVRGYLARKRVRKIFSKAFSKQYDPQSGQYFYYNAITGQSTWEKPKIMKHIFPQVKNW